MKKSYFKLLFLAFLLPLFYNCAAVPPEVIKTHQKEFEIIENLQSSHLAMVDAFVDQKILVFENFFFNEYGPVYRSNWIDAFKEYNERDYDSERDFPKLYNDLVAEYQEELAPIEKIRFNLKTAIALEYKNAIDAHTTVERWLDNLKKLNDSQRTSINSFLGSVKPGLSMSTLDDTIKNRIENVKSKMSKKNE
ncbi:hypothetical protein [Lutibacter flavus]|uniref:DUF4296 domain-containing protein n=1 Tax=Lutibacter flavus TaxID=691689 RepID=A0A238VLY9_9FLAO|nr:hypothetical protein [Lutibacter flavus]SNR35184.1 hypothetical protein SAMN04488111_0686 [Lutibacter flavus]